MRSPKGILSLDFSLRTGWAAGSAGEPPLAGAWMLPPVVCLGRCYAALDNELSDAIAVFQPREIVCEAPLIMKQQTSAELLQGLWATAQQTAYRCDVPIRKIAVSTVRAEVLGTARLGKTAECKTTIMAWCRAQGWKVEGDDEADAMLIWAWATGYRTTKLRKAA